MKLNKTALALYAVSLTAGTIYTVYLQFKDRLMKQVMKLWREQAEKAGKAIKEPFLLDELDKLHYLDINLLYSYSKAKIINDKQKEEELKVKLEKKQILRRAEIEKPLDGIIF